MSEATEGSEEPPAAPRVAGAGGGLADKLGNKYELAWAVHHALRCIQDERRSITLEDLDPELADGSEFTFVDEHGTVSVTQVKRQNSITDHWTIAALRSRGIFAAAQRHVGAGREYHFNSMTPCGALRVLSEWTRQSAGVDQFLTRQLTQQMSPTFDELTALDIFGSAENAWQTLRSIWFEVGDEEQLIKTNASLAEAALEGAPGSLLSVAIGAVLLDNLRQRLTRRELLEGLSKHGIGVRNEAAKRTAQDEVAAQTTSWRGTVERELLSPAIARSEAADLMELMQSTRLALVVAQAVAARPRSPTRLSADSNRRAQRSWPFVSTVSARSAQRSSWAPSSDSPRHQSPHSGWRQTDAMHT